MFYSCTNSNNLDKETKEPIFYINIKLKELWDILREVLKDIYSISLIEDKPFISILLREYNIALTRT
jgi:hypothetical protein